jgi:hypothetical protein
MMRVRQNGRAKIMETLKLGAIFSPVQMHRPHNRRSLLLFRWRSERHHNDVFDYCFHPGSAPGTDEWIQRIRSSVPHRCGRGWARAGVRKLECRIPVHFRQINTLSVAYIMFLAETSRAGVISY